MSAAGAIRAGGAFIEIWAQDGRFQQAMNRVAARIQATAALVRRIGTEMVMGGTAIGMPMLLASRQAAKFEDTLLGMRAAAGLAEADIATLQKEVMRLSMAMGVDPTAISTAFLELTKAGMGVDAVLAGAGRSAVEFARVSGVEMADAAVFMKVAMNTFGVSATQAVDTLSAAADQSETTLQELVQAFALVGSAGVTFDQTLSDLSTGLAVLARYKIVSEEAGTGIKTMLMRLVSPADTAVEALSRLGLTLSSFRDADGDLLPLMQIVDILSKATEGMDSELVDKLIGDIFGDRAIRIIGAFIHAGMDGFQAMQAAMRESLPVSEKFAIMMMGLTGAFQRVYAAVQRFAIVFTAAVGPAFGDLVDYAVFALESLGQLAQAFPLVVQRVVLATAAVTSLGVALIVAGFSMSVVSRSIRFATSTAVLLLSPITTLGRLLAFLGLQAVQAGTAFAAAFARMSLAVLSAVGSMLPALGALIARLAVGGVAAAAMFIRAMVGVQAAVASAAAAMAAAAASALPRVLAIFGVTAAELVAGGGMIAAALNRVTFGLAGMAARAAISFAALSASAVTSIPAIPAMVGRAMLGVVSTVVYAATALSAAAIASLPRVLAVFGVTAAELANAAGIIASSINRVTFGLAGMAARAVASFAMMAASAVAAMAPTLAFFGSAAVAALGAAGPLLITAGIITGIGAAAIAAGYFVAQGLDAIYQGILGLVGKAQSALQGMITSVRASAVAWGQQLSWMYEQLKAQNYSAIWQAMQIDFNIAMLMIGKHATVAAMNVRGAWSAAALYIYDSMTNALEKMGAEFGLLVERIRYYVNVAIGHLQLLFHMIANGGTADDAYVDSLIERIERPMAAAEERANASRASAEERRQARQAAAGERQAAIDEAKAPFDEDIETLRGELARLMEPKAAADPQPPATNDIEPTEFREPRAGIGEGAGAGSGIGTTQGTFGSGEGLGVGPELNKLQEHAAATAARAAEIAGHAKRGADLLAVIAAGKDGADIGEQVDPAIEDLSAAGVPGPNTIAAMPGLAAQSQAGLAQSAQIGQLRVAITQGMDAVTQAIRENTSVTSGQSGQLSTIAAAIATLRGSLV